MTDVFHHPWLGGLFGDPEMAAILSPAQSMQHMLAFEAAFTRALGKTGAFSADITEDMAQQIAAFRPDLEDIKNGTACDGVPVPALVAQIKQHVSGPAQAIHNGATSQDVIDTALALTLRDVNDLLEARLDALSLSLDALTDRFGTNTLMGRTRMQAALPITVADRIATWSQPLQDHRTRLSDQRPKVEVLQLGGATGDRAALGADATAIAADVAARLQLGNPPRAWHAARANIVDYASLLSLISGSLGKMGQDICLMAQNGIDEIKTVSGGGSSAMPHKLNPVTAELLVTLARFNASQVSAMHSAMIHEQERSGASWALEWMVLPQMITATSRGLDVASDLCKSVIDIGASTGSGAQ
jgi:3-carboxy-cis,cis-muconate cycloisomerase